MPRSIWNGTVLLGRIPVAVKVYAATEAHTIHFHQVHAADGERRHQRRVCPKEGREVPAKEIVKGYAIGRGVRRAQPGRARRRGRRPPRGTRGGSRAGRRCRVAHDAVRRRARRSDKPRRPASQARGETPDIEPEQPSEQDTDLMAALEASLTGSQR